MCVVVFCTVLYLLCIMSNWKRIAIGVSIVVVLYLRHMYVTEEQKRRSGEEIRARIRENSRTSTYGFRSVVAALPQSLQAAIVPTSRKSDAEVVAGAVEKQQQLIGLNTLLSDVTNTVNSIVENASQRVVTSEDDSSEVTTLVDPEQVQQPDVYVTRTPGGPGVIGRQVVSVIPPKIGLTHSVPSSSSSTQAMRINAPPMSSSF